jgi:hypothetical protein
VRGGLKLARRQEELEGLHPSSLGGIFVLARVPLGAPAPTPIPNAPAAQSTLVTPDCGALVGQLEHCVPNSDGLVEIEIVRRLEADWGDIVERYHLREVVRSENALHALAPPSVLCGLGKASRVQSVWRFTTVTPAQTGAPTLPSTT